MRDTTVDAEQVRLAAVRGMEPAARLRQALELSEWARHLALTGLKVHHPERSEFQLVEMLVGTPLMPITSPRAAS